jgi:hypothetical protein
MRNTQLEFAKLLFAAYLFAGSVCGFLCLSYETQYTITIFSGFILDLLFFYIISSSCIHFMLSVYFVLMYARYWFKSLPLSDIKFSSNDFYWGKFAYQKASHLSSLTLFRTSFLFIREIREHIRQCGITRTLQLNLSLLWMYGLLRREKRPLLNEMTFGPICRRFARVLLDWLFLLSNLLHLLFIKTLMRVETFGIMVEF